MLVEGTFIKIRFTFLPINKLPSNNMNCREGIYVASRWKRIDFIQGKKSKVLAEAQIVESNYPDFESVSMWLKDTTIIQSRLKVPEVQKYNNWP